MSVRHPTAVDQQGGAGDRRSAVAAEECNRSGDFLDRYEALGWLLRQEDLANNLIAADAMRLRLALDLALNQRCPHIAGTHRIAGHATLGGLKCNNLGQADDAVLRSNIGRLERRSDQPVR